jgi:hypothetical protein
MLRNLLLLFAVITFSANGQDKVNYISDGAGTISLRIIAYGKKSKDAIVNAEKTAIQTLLFRGIPGSNQVENPMISTNEVETQKKYADYFRNLFDKERCRSFIMSNIPVSEFAKDATKKKCITVDVKVNLKALQSDLEYNGIVRKFGF